MATRTTAKPVTKAALDAAEAAALRGLKTIDAYFKGKRPVSPAELKKAQRDNSFYVRLHAKHVNEKIKKAPKAVRDEMARWKRGEF